jgi:hypothetical protein
LKGSTGLEWTALAVGKAHIAGLLDAHVITRRRKVREVEYAGFVGLAGTAAHFRRQPDRRHLHRPAGDGVDDAPGNATGRRGRLRLAAGGCIARRLLGRRSRPAKQRDQRGDPDRRERLTAHVNY